MVPKNQEFSTIYYPIEGDILEGVIEGVYIGTFRRFLKVTDYNDVLWSLKECASIDKQIDALNLVVGDKVRITYNGQGEDYLTAHDYKIEKFQDNQWKFVNTKTLIEYLFDPEKGDCIEGEILEVFVGEFDKYVLKIKTTDEKVYLTKQCYSMHKQIKQLTLEKGDYVKVNYLGRGSTGFKVHKYLIELKTGENMAWKTVKDLNETDEFEGTIYKPVVGDILEGDVVDVKRGQFRKLFLKVKDEDNKLWITIQCGSLHNQIRKLAIKPGDKVQIEYKGQYGDNNRHAYILRKWEE